MYIILKKELSSYFFNINTYIISVLFLVLSSLLLWVIDSPFNIFMLGKANLELFFSLSPWLFCFLMPALAMGVIAEEEANGTLEWLFSQPIKISSVVFGKLAALKIVLLFIFLPTLVFTFTINQLSLDKSDFDLGLLLSNYLGLFLLGVLFLCVGIFCSSITKSQLVAYIMGFFISFFLFFGLEGLANFDLVDKNDYWVQKIGLSFHYSNFIKGIIDTRSFFYLILLSFLFLSFSIYSLNLKKR